MLFEKLKMAKFSCLTKSEQKKISGGLLDGGTCTGGGQSYVGCQYGNMVNIGGTLTGGNWMRLWYNAYSSDVDYGGGNIDYIGGGLVSGNWFGCGAYSCYISSSINSANCLSYSD